MWTNGHQAFPFCFCILQAIKNWMVGRPGNEATDWTHSEMGCKMAACYRASLNKQHIPIDVVKSLFAKHANIWGHTHSHEMNMVWNSTLRHAAFNWETVAAVDNYLKTTTAVNSKEDCLIWMRRQFLTHSTVIGRRLGLNELNEIISNTVIQLLRRVSQTGRIHLLYSTPLNHHSPPSQHHPPPLPTLLHSPPLSSTLLHSLPLFSCSNPSWGEERAWRCLSYTPTCRRTHGCPTLLVYWWTRSWHCAAGRLPCTLRVLAASLWDEGGQTQARVCICVCEEGGVRACVCGYGWMHVGMCGSKLGSSQNNVLEVKNIRYITTTMSGQIQH